MHGFWRRAATSSHRQTHVGFAAGRTPLAHALGKRWAYTHALARTAGRALAAACLHSCLIILHIHYLFSLSFLSAYYLCDEQRGRLRPVPSRCRLLDMRACRFSSDASWKDFQLSKLFGPHAVGARRGCLTCDAPLHNHTFSIPFYRLGAVTYRACRTVASTLVCISRPATRLQGRRRLTLIPLLPCLPLFGRAPRVCCLPLLEGLNDARAMTPVATDAGRRFCDICYVCYTRWRVAGRI